MVKQNAPGIKEITRNEEISDDTRETDDMRAIYKNCCDQKEWNGKC